MKSNLEIRIENLEKQMCELIKNISFKSDFDDKNLNSCRFNIDSTYKIANENTENIEINTDTIATVMEVVLPTQSDTLEGVADTLDTLMTDIIPSLMGSE